ncbi:MAG TPA: transcriptional repressor LexA [Thermomicrobiales bacterium]|nr:transcriptional repressor LexA [Thermomicrobiales bacterium]
MKPLTGRQQAILDYIGRFMDDNDYPPTIRDIQSELDISSTSVVDYNLKVIEDRGYIRRNRNISRGIELAQRDRSRRAGAALLTIPVVGRIAAGQPIPVPGDLEALGTSDAADTVEVGQEMVGGNPAGVFALRVSGLSMIDALINDGDIVLLRQQATAENGDTVAAWLRDERETTLKKFYLEGEQVRLQPANSTMEPIYTRAENVEIQGRLVGVVRTMF